MLTRPPLSTHIALGSAAAVLSHVRTPQVERLLSRVDAVLYVLDYTKLKTAEEQVVLGRLGALNPALLSRLCSRLFFVVNKFDQAAEGTGMGADDTRHYVATLITQSLLGVPGFKLHPDQVC